MDLITGATGFIGRHLTERLIGAGHPLRLFCRPESIRKLPPLPEESVEIFRGDLCERDYVEQALQGVERVFHCAGHVLDWGSKGKFDATNVQGTQWLLEAAGTQRVKRFVHLSSIAVFGIPSPAYFDDDTPHNPGRDHYSRTKAESEVLAFREFRENGLPVVVLRPSVVYGPYSGWVEEPIRMIRENRMFLIGGGSGSCHPCHIDNLIDAMLLASEHPNAVGRGFNVSDGQSTTFKDYFGQLARIVGSKPLARSIPVPVARFIASILETAHKVIRLEGRPLLTHSAIDLIATRSVMASDGIRKELGFEPKVSLEEGMDLLKQWLETSGERASSEKESDVQ